MPKSLRQEIAWALRTLATGLVCLCLVSLGFFCFSSDKEVDSIRKRTMRDHRLSRARGIITETDGEIDALVGFSLAVLRILEKANPEDDLTEVRNEVLRCRGKLDRLSRDFYELLEDCSKE